MIFYSCRIVKKGLFNFYVFLSTHLMPGKSKLHGEVFFINVLFF